MSEAMSTKWRVPLGVLVLLAVASAALLWANVWAARSSFSAQTSQQSYRVGTKVGEGVAYEPVLTVYVEGDDLLAQELLAALPRAMAAGESPFETVSRLTELPVGLPAGQGPPVVVVRFTERSVAWTPVFARSLLRARVSYASDGATDWLEDTPPAIAGAADPVLRVRISVEVTERSVGVLSRPAYTHRLARSLADEVAAAFRVALAGGAAP